MKKKTFEILNVHEHKPNFNNFKNKQKNTNKNLFVQARVIYR